MKSRILVVEDDEVFLRPLRRALELAGHEVLAAPSAEHALARLEDAAAVDVVLTDRRLPGMDGLELTRRVKAGHPGVAVLVMTGLADGESAREARRAGADGWLRKPFEVDDLLAALRPLVDGDVPADAGAARA